METRSHFSSIPVRASLMLLMAAALAAGCGVSKSKYENITKERDDLATQNTQLKTNLDQATKDKAQLESDKAALDSQVKEMDAKIQEQQAKEAEFKATYDQMIKHMESEMNSGKVEIQQMKDGISVNLAQDILFPSGSADLDKSGKELLLKVSEDLKASPYQVIVTGNTDNQKIGGKLASKYPSNWELGGARASRIVRLFEDSGITKDRLAAVSFADSRPREANETPEGRAKNRRIEIKLRPMETTQTAGQ
jgi:chemotaxis protein MotB